MTNVANPYATFWLMDAHHRREALLNWLRSRGTATASDAADKFGVSTRTILRDVAALRERGEPIESDAGRGGGLRVDLLRSLPPIRVRLEDVVGAFLWVQLARLSSHVGMYAAVDPAVEKLMGILPPARAVEIRKTLRRVVVGSGPAEGPGGPGEPATLAVIERALNTRRGMSFDLAGAAGWAIEPQGILLEGPVWFLLGTDRSTGEAGRFRLDEITGAALLDEVRVQHLPLDGYVRRAAAPAGWSARLHAAPA